MGSGEGGEGNLNGIYFTANLKRGVGEVGAFS